MNSRMEKYNYNKNVVSGGRIEKNKKIYDELTDLNVSYIDINDANVFEINDYKKEKRTRADYQKQKEYEGIINFAGTAVKNPIEIEPEQQKVEKIYDINEILKKAKEDKLFEETAKKRLINTEYNILTKLDINKINNSNEFSKDDLKGLIDTIYSNNQLSDPIDDNKNLFEDLMLNEKDNELSQKAESEKSVSIDNNFLHDENKDTAIEIETKEVEIKKALEDEEEKEKSKLGLFVIITVIILLAIGTYLFLKYFGTL